MHSNWFLYHHNSYLHTKDVVQTDCKGSKRRNDTLLKMAPPKNVNEVIKLLGNTDDNLEPIYRMPNTSHLDPDSRTSATAIFDLTRRQLMVYRSNPGTSKRPCVTLPFMS